MNCEICWKVAVSPQGTTIVKGTVPPVGALGGLGRDRAGATARDGDPHSLTGACDTFVILL